MTDEQVNEVVHLRRQVSELERKLEASRDVLSTLSSWVGNGLGGDSTSVDEYESRIREGVDRIIDVEGERLQDALADARALRAAGSLMLRSLGEYVRQSMDQNPEWAAGIRALWEAVEINRKEPTGIYVVSKVRHAPMWRKMREDGVPIISSWIDIEMADGEPDWSNLWSICIQEASIAKQIVVYVEPGERLKGSLVEIGVGLTRRVPIKVVGDPTGQGTWWRARNVTRVSEWEGLTAPVRRMGPSESDAELRRLADTLDTGGESPSGMVTCALAHVGIVENERDAARKAGARLYDYLHEALNTWLPGMAEEAGCDEEEGNEGILYLTELLAETAKPIGKET